jgi:hypothetical protein
MCDLLNLDSGAGTVKKHPELVTSDPGKGVGALQDRLESGGDQTEEFISNGMALQVVHPLEVVQVDQKNSEAFASALSIPNGVVQVAVEQRTVGQTREAVMKYLVLQLRSALFDLDLELATEREVIDEHEELTGRHRHHDSTEADLRHCVQ